MEWVIVEGAGTDNERVIDEFPEFGVAMAAALRRYGSDEMEALNVDIMKRLPGGSLTTEY